MGDRGREERVGPGPLCFGSGGCEFLSGLRSVVTNSPLPQRTQLVWGWSCQGSPMLKACSKGSANTQNCFRLDGASHPDSKGGTTHGLALPGPSLS